VPPTPIPEEISGSIDYQPAQQVEELTVIVEVFTYTCPFDVRILEFYL